MPSGHPSPHSPTTTYENLIEPNRSTSHAEISLYSKRSSDRGNHGSSDAGRRTSKVEKPWIASHLRVRIVSRSFAKGAYYCKKGLILDVLTPLTCTIQLEQGDMVEGMSGTHWSNFVPFIHVPSRASTRRVCIVVCIHGIFYDDRCPSACP